ncbi:exopolyphosphatase, partial [Reticulomyxa filosa]
KEYMIGIDWGKSETIRHLLSKAGYKKSLSSTKNAKLMTYESCKANLTWEECVAHYCSLDVSPNAMVESFHSFSWRKRKEAAVTHKGNSLLSLFTRRYSNTLENKQKEKEKENKGKKQDAGSLSFNKPRRDIDLIEPCGSKRTTFDSSLVNRSVPKKVDNKDNEKEKEEEGGNDNNDGNDDDNNQDSDEDEEKEKKDERTKKQRDKDKAKKNGQVERAKDPIH